MSNPKQYTALELVLLDLLDAMFTRYEDGVACYGNPEELEDFVGYAIHLDEETFKQIADVLNEHKPQS